MLVSILFIPEHQFRASETHTIQPELLLVQKLTLVLETYENKFYLKASGTVMETQMVICKYLNGQPREEFSEEQIVGTILVPCIQYSTTEQDNSLSTSFLELSDTENFVDMA